MTIKSESLVSRRCRRRAGASHRAKSASSESRVLRLYSFEIIIESSRALSHSPLGDRLPVKYHYPKTWVFACGSFQVRIRLRASLLLQWERCQGHRDAGLLEIHHQIETNLRYHKRVASVCLEPHIRQFFTCTCASLLKISLRLRDPHTLRPGSR